MPSLNDVKDMNSSHQFSYLPVAIFVGGTSGIGQATAEAFAQITKGNAHIIILGRNRNAAESTIARFPRPTSPDAIHEFVECDVSLMKNVAHFTTELLSRLSRLNFLVLSSGTLNFEGRNETVEGIDKKLAVNYYARWKIAHDLLPLLQKAKDEGQAASVLSVLDPTGAGKIDLDDLGLKKNYGISVFTSSSSTYNDLMLEAFAERHPNLTYTHIFPGLVRTAILNKLFTHWALAPVNWALKILTYPFSVTAEHSAQIMLYALLQPESGVFRRNDKGSEIGHSIYDSEETRSKLWEHTEKEIQSAINGET